MKSSLRRVSPPFFNTYRCHRVFDNEACTSWVKGRWVGMNGKARVARPLAHMIHKSQQRWGWKKERKKNSRRLAAYYYCTTCYSLSLMLDSKVFSLLFLIIRPSSLVIIIKSSWKDGNRFLFSFFLFGGSCGWIGVGKWADASHRSFWSTIESNRNGFIEPWKTYCFLFLLQKKNKLTTFLFATPFNILAILLHILMERTKLLLINQFSSYYEMIF